MKFIKTDKGYVVRLYKYESVITCLTQFCEDENILSGFFNGLGGACEAELGFYYTDRKEYEFKKFGACEIVNLIGNISIIDKKPFLHAHAVIADTTFACYGGHLKEATVSATCEVLITPFQTTLKRALDEQIGLKLLTCEA